MNDIVNNENYPAESSPLITLRGKVLNRDTCQSPSTPKSTEKRYNNCRNSPRRSRPNSPKISRLPIRSAANTRFSIKELHLPPDESVTNCGAAVRTTPEKLMEELRDEVKKKKMERPARIVDEEISLSVSNCILERITAETDTLRITSAATATATGTARPRMSMRNRQPVMVDAPDLVYEDPLEVARQTLANTRANSGYKQCKLIYTTERRRSGRASSPEPAFSKKTGITRHFLTIDEAEVEETAGTTAANKSLKFDRVLKLFESNESESEVVDYLKVDLKRKPKKSCLKPSPPPNTQSTTPPTSLSQTQIVQIKRICYEEEEGEGDVELNEIVASPTKKRRIGNGAKRLKKID